MIVPMISKFCFQQRRREHQVQQRPEEDARQVVSRHYA